jgi:hypothetical protein
MTTLQKKIVTLPKKGHMKLCLKKLIRVYLPRHTFMGVITGRLIRFKQSKKWYGKEEKRLVKDYGAINCSLVYRLHQRRCGCKSIRLLMNQYTLNETWDFRGFITYQRTKLRRFGWKFWLFFSGSDNWKTLPMDRQCMCNVTCRRVRVTTAAAEKQYVLSNMNMCM